MRGIGLQLREGLHTGEVELRDGDVGGVVVHIAARVMDAARPGEILTSRTVRTWSWALTSSWRTGETSG